MSSFPSFCIGSALWFTGVGITSSCLALRYQDEDVLPDDEKKALLEKVNELAARLGLNKSIEVRVNTNFQTVGAQVIGSELLPGKAVMIVDPALISKYRKVNKLSILFSGRSMNLLRMDYLENPALSKDELEFILAHELSHIKSNDQLMILIALFLGSIFLQAVMSVCFGEFKDLSVWLWTLMFQYILVLLLGFKVSRCQEKAADLRALSICSPEARRVASCCYQKSAELHKKIRESERDGLLSTCWNRLVISPGGDYQLDLTHPPLTERIQYLQQASQNQ